MKTYILKKEFGRLNIGDEVTVENRVVDGFIAWRVRQDGDFVGEVALSDARFYDWFEEKKPTRWLPKKGEDCWILTEEGEARLWEFDDVLTWEKARFDFGNCFETREQAEEAANRIKAVLEEYHKELAK